MDGPQDLFDAAVAVRAHAYVPYSRYPVGVALREADGRIFTGVNVENAAYPVGTCAEAGAIAAMVAAGGRTLTEILVVAAGPSLVTPCGACRQRIFEFGGRAAIVWCADLDAVRKRFTCETLLPYGFGPETLEASAGAAHPERT